MQNIFREFIFILFDRIRLITIVFLAVFILSAAVAVTLPSIYRSTSKFSLVIPQGFDPLQQENSFDYRNRMRRYLQDQKELILSNRVLEKVLQILNPGTKQSVSINLIDQLRTNLNVSPPGGETFEGSNVFILEYIDPDPARAMQIANAVTQGYLDTYLDISRSKTDYSHAFFVEQTQKLNKEMLDKENKLRDFEIKQALALIEIMNLEPGKANLEVGPNMLLNQFLRSSHDLQIELAGLNMSIEFLDREVNKKGIPVVPLEMEVSGRAISVFKTKVSQLQIQLNEMRPQFKENYEPLKQVEQELNLSVESLKKELERSVNAQKISAHSIEARIRQLEKIIHDLKERIQTTAREKAGYENLKQEYNLARDAYSRAMGQLEQARMAQSLNQEKQFLTLIDKPALPTKPFKPNRLLIAVGGLFAGIFLGIAVALTVDHFDHRIKTLYDIETHLNVPVLGSIPSV
ncbi:MAG: Wzz/FepE/Etk N-terminal domain-containing protein [Pseudomonadota bacterium]